jgi:TolB-like protein
MKTITIIMLVLILFSIPGWADQQKLEKSLYGLSKALIESYENKEGEIFKLNISIGEIENKSPRAQTLQMGQVVREMLLSIFSRSNLFAVIERDKLDMILSEQELQLSGITDAASAVEIGNILNARVILYGSVTELGDSFVISCSLVDVETGKSITEQVTVNQEVITKAAEKRLDMMYVQPMGIGISLSGIGITYAGSNPSFIPFPDVNNTIVRRNISLDVRYRMTRFLMIGMGIEYIYGQLDHFNSLSWDMGLLDYPEPTGTAPFNIVGEGIGIPLTITLVYAPLRWVNVFLSLGGEYFILECEGYFEPSNGLGFGVNDFGPSVHAEFISFRAGLGGEVFVTPRMAFSLVAGYEFGAAELDTAGMWHIPGMPDTEDIDVSGFTTAVRVSFYF